MRAGNLDRRWELQSFTTSQDAFGEEDKSWSTFDTVWGSWEPLKGSEQWDAKQFIERSVARVRIRYRSDVDAQIRIVNSTLGTFEVIGEPEHRRREGETVLHVSRIV